MISLLLFISIRIRTTFIEDVNAGVRKTDFYQYVTEHLGRTGYRDVWHLLKIAYPHVDRVRRGRKYMYWGIRHASQGIPSEPTSSDDQDPSPDREMRDGEEEFVSDAENDELYEEDKKRMAVLSSEWRSVNEDSPTPDGYHGNGIAENMKPASGKSTNCKDRQLLEVAVKVESDCTKQDVVVMEFKENQVFESFEDYEKSRVVDNNGNWVSGKARAFSKDMRNRCHKKEIAHSAKRSVSPPLEIFSSEIMIDSEKYNQFSSGLPTTAMNCGNSNPKKELDARRRPETPREEQDSCYGNSVDQDRKSAGQEKQGSTNCNNWIMNCGSSAFGSGLREATVPNLLEPENINRMCMPLIQDLKRKSTRKAQRKTSGDNSKSQLKKTTDSKDDAKELPGRSLSTAASSNSLFDMSSPQTTVAHCHPIIVAVASIADTQGRNKPLSSDEKTKVNETMESLGPSAEEVSENQNTTKSDVEFVVVRDRGTQVSERAINCAPENAARQANGARPCGQQLQKSKQESKVNAYNNGHTCLATNSAVPWQPMYGQTKRNISQSGKSTTPRSNAMVQDVRMTSVSTGTVDGRTLCPSTLPQTPFTSRSLKNSGVMASTTSRGRTFQREILKYPHPLETLRSKSNSVPDSRCSPLCTTATPTNRVNAYSRAESTGVYFGSSPRGVYLVPSPRGVYFVPSPRGVYLVPSPRGVYFVPSPRGVYLVPSPRGVYFVPSPREFTSGRVHGEFTSGRVHGEFTSCRVHGEFTSCRVHGSLPRAESTGVYLVQQGSQPTRVLQIPQTGWK